MVILQFWEDTLKLRFPFGVEMHWSSHLGFGRVCPNGADIIEAADLPLDWRM